jgi:hypothetical protein
MVICGRLVVVSFSFFLFPVFVYKKGQSSGVERKKVGSIPFYVGIEKSPHGD